MANRKYSEDDVLTSIDDADKIGVLDASDPTDGIAGTSKEILWSSFKTLLNALYARLTGATFTGDVEINTASDPMLRLAHNASLTSPFDIFDDSANIGRISKTGLTGNTLIDIDPIPSDGTSASAFRFFRYVNTSGLAYFQLHYGDGTSGVNSRFGANDDTYIGSTYGNLIFGGSVSPSGGGRVLVLAQATGDPTGIPSNVAGLVAKDNAGTTELYAWDEAGNVTQLTPHAKDAPAWIYDLQPGIEIVNKSANVYTGSIEWANETRKNTLLQKQIEGEEMPSNKDARTFHFIETFSEYNQRTEDSLEVQDWDENQSNWYLLRQAEIAMWNELKPKNDADILEWEELSDKEKEKKDKPEKLGDKPKAYIKKAKPDFLK